MIKESADTKVAQRIEELERYSIEMQGYAKQLEN